MALLNADVLDCLIMVAVNVEGNDGMQHSRLDAL